MTIATSTPRTDRAYAAPVERGQGAPIVLIPGIQGRWEWMAPTIAELGVHHRVRTFSLGDVEGVTDPTRAFDAWVAHIDRLCDVAGDRRVVVAGVSFGGLIAACYAGRRPDRVSALVLISAPPPEWPQDHPAARNVRHPLLLLPQFIAQAAGRLVPEVRALDLGAGQRLKFVVEHVGRLLRFPASPFRMAAYARAWSATDLRADCRHITAPTLVITGEPALDRVVPVAGTLEYLQLIPGARHVTLERTGHLGVISRPRALSDLVSAFVAKTVELPDDGPRRQEHKAG